jgi:hypothetical protein
MAIASAWLETLGLLVATQATGGESSQTIYDILGGSGAIVASLAMVAIVLGTVAVNSMNDYTGSLSLLAAGVRVKRIYSAAAVGVLGFLFTLLLNTGDFATNFTNFLLFISYWITPFIGVVLADWWLRRQQADPQSIVDFSALPTGTIGLVALVVGFAVGIPFQNSTLGSSCGAVQLRDRELPPRRRPRLLRRRRRGLPHLLVRLQGDPPPFRLIQRRGAPARSDRAMDPQATTRRRSRGDHARAPNPPCVQVWLSPQTIRQPGRLRPSSGPTTWTMP